MGVSPQDPVLHCLVGQRKPGGLPAPLSGGSEEAQGCTHTPQSPCSSRYLVGQSVKCAHRRQKRRLPRTGEIRAPRIACQQHASTIASPRPLQSPIAWRDVCARSTCAMPSYHRIISSNATRRRHTAFPLPEARPTNRVPPNPWLLPPSPTASSLGLSFLRLLAAAATLFHLNPLDGSLGFDSSINLALRLPLGRIELCCDELVGGGRRLLGRLSRGVRFLVYLVGPRWPRRRKPWQGCGLAASGRRVGLRGCGRLSLRRGLLRLALFFWPHA